MIDSLFFTNSESDFEPVLIEIFYWKCLFAFVVTGTPIIIRIAWRFDKSMFPTCNAIYAGFLSNSWPKSQSRLHICVQ